MAMSYSGFRGSMALAPLNDLLDGNPHQPPHLGDGAIYSPLSLVQVGLRMQPA